MRSVAILSKVAYLSTISFDGTVSGFAGDGAWFKLGESMIWLARPLATGLPKAVIPLTLRF